jgi:hypothetical protein
MTTKKERVAPRRGNATHLLEQLPGRLDKTDSADQLDLQAAWLIHRLRLSPSTAKAVAALAFGGEAG